MDWQKELDELRRREELASQLGGPERVKRQHDGGRLTILERVAKLADPGSFHEIGKIAGSARYDAKNDLVAFTPKPRVVKLRLTPMADEQVTLNESPMQAARYIVKPELGFFASLLLFDLPSLRCWILPGEAPAFLKAEGPLYFMGPVWRIEPF